MMRNRLLDDTTAVHVKGIFGVYLEYYWGIDYYKIKIQALNTRILFFKLYEVKEIWCTQKLFSPFHLKFQNCHIQSELLQF